MKKLFPGYYTPSNEEFQQLWNECIFGFDTSMLLNIYRYSRETQNVFLTILEGLKDRIWIPHQAAIEFSKNRATVIESQLNAYDDVARMLDGAYDALDNQLKTFLRHPSIAIADVLAPVRSGLDAAKYALAKNKENHPDLSKGDPVGDKLFELIDGRVGVPFSNQNLLTIYEEGELRYQLQQPPGYMDTKTKKGNDKYGDLVLWLQVIEYAKKEHKPIILVTGENKEDWWQKEKGKTVSPRPELTNEIHDKSGVGFYLYQSAQFLKYAQKFLKLEDQKAAVQEAEEISRHDEAIETAVNYLATKDWIDKRMVNNFGVVDNVLLRRASEAAKMLENPLTRNAIESAKLFNETFQNPVLRRALEDFDAIKSPLLAPNSERARAADSTVMQHIKDVSRLVNDPAASRIAEISQLLDSSAIRRISDAQAALTNPFLKDHLEAARYWQNHPLRGMALPRDIDIEVSPKRSSDLSTAESSRVRVQVISDAEDNSESEAASEEVDAESAPDPSYELNNFPRVITLTHRRNSSHPFETSHRLRRPTNDEWNKWGQDIKRSRRYLSQAEIDEHNVDREEDEKPSEMWLALCSEWEANESLYNKILLEIAGIHLDDNDEFPSDQFRVLPPETIEQLQFEIKSTVITELYECYCEIVKDEDEQTRRVKQQLMISSLPQNVMHILRKPTESESLEFRTTIVTGEFAQDEEGREIIQLRLNLSVANDSYNSLIQRIENATVDSRVFSAETRTAFLDAINPVYKLRLLEPLFGVRAWYFKVDDMLFP